MKIAYVKDNELYTSNGDKIDKPSICVDGDCALFWGDNDKIIKRYGIMSKGLDVFNDEECDWNLNFIPLWEKLSIEDCCFVINNAYNDTSSGFIRNLGEKFNTDELQEWLNKEKKRKDFGHLFKSIKGLFR